MRAAGACPGPHRPGCDGSSPSPRGKTISFYASGTRAAESLSLKQICQGASPCRSTSFIYDFRFTNDERHGETCCLVNRKLTCRVGPIGRGVPLRTGRLKVRILHMAPISKDEVRRARGGANDDSVSSFAFLTSDFSGVCG